MEKRKQTLRRFAAAAAGLLALLVLAAALYLLWERPPLPAPDTEEDALETRVGAGPEAAADTAGSGAEAAPVGPAGVTYRGSERKSGVYTLLLAGSDSCSGNTDTILLGRLDTSAHRLDLVSIPRDTLVNRDWRVRKLNAVYAGTANGGGVALDGLRRELRRLCGFTPDCCAVVDLAVFAEAIDLVGGVDFEVPQDMHYEDPAQDLRIDLDAGPQHLDGAQAMGLVRFREGYLNGDLDRLALQQEFLKAAFSQILGRGNIPRLGELVKLLSERTDTGLSAANIAWLARQTLQCRAEDVRLHTMPTVPVTLQGLSYTVADLEPWLALLNDCLNPYAAPIGAEQLDLVYREDGAYRATSGVLRGARYYE